MDHHSRAKNSSVIMQNLNLSSLELTPRNGSTTKMNFFTSCYQQEFRKYHQTYSEQLQRLDSQKPLKEEVLFL